MTIQKVYKIFDVGYSLQFLVDETDFYVTHFFSSVRKNMKLRKSQLSIHEA